MGLRWYRYLAVFIYPECIDSRKGLGASGQWRNYGRSDGFVSEDRRRRQRNSDGSEYESGRSGCDE